MSDERGTAKYVHRPDDHSESESDAPEHEADASNAETTDADAFGAKGWVLVGVLVLSVLVIPGLIYLYPAAPADAGLPFLAAMLALPMIPAVLLGLTAVWSMTAATNEKSTPD